MLFNFIIFTSIKFENYYFTSKSNSLHNEKSENLYTSSVIGHLNLTNYQVNNSVYYHGDIMPLKGKIYEPVPPPPPYVNLEGLNVSVSLDGVLYSEFSATSDSYGEFHIDFEIPNTANIYTSHKIKVEVTDDLGGNEIESISYYIINVKARSILQNLNFQDNLYLTGESVDVSGLLVYDNGTGIPNKTLDYRWFNNTYQWDSNQLNISSDGSFTNSLAIPVNATPNNISLSLSYGGMASYIDPSSASIQGIRIFSGIGCDWNITNLNSVDNYTEGDNITIRGIVYTSHNRSLKLVNRSIKVYYDGAVISTLKTNNNGAFKTNYTIPRGSGNKPIEVRLVSTSDRQVSATNAINITQEPPPPPPPPPSEPVPFMDFFIYFIPILAGIVGALVVYGFFYYRRQRQKSRFAKVPLGNKIVNLNILKETNRLEESLSYLFTAIFSELVKAKYGRERKDNETIRDFAILMVKEFQLQPASIYPFIQKIEEVIYAESFKVTEDNFNKACDLFAPIYFQLTGQNFALNIEEFKN
jgi:hypothetical protein